MNVGKQFEQQFRKSVPKDVFCYRLKDSSNIWGSNNNVRYTPSNICDYFLFDGNYLCLLELKNCKTKSLPLSNIRQHQIDELMASSIYANVIAGLVINFRDVNRCFFIEISDVIDFIDNNTRKSIPIAYLEEKGLEITCIKKRINYVYDVEKFLNDLVVYI